jgi:hypothetical protein
MMASSCVVARFVLPEGFDPAAPLDTIKRHRCTIHIGFLINPTAMVTSP